MFISQSIKRSLSDEIFSVFTSSSLNLTNCDFYYQDSEGSWQHRAFLQQLLDVCMSIDSIDTDLPYNFVSNLLGELNQYSIDVDNKLDVSGEELVKISSHDNTITIGIREDFTGDNVDVERLREARFLVGFSLLLFLMQSRIDISITAETFAGMHNGNFNGFADLDLRYKTFEDVATQQIVELTNEAYITALYIICLKMYMPDTFFEHVYNKKIKDLHWSKAEEVSLLVERFNVPAKMAEQRISVATVGTIIPV